MKRLGILPKKGQAKTGFSDQKVDNQMWLC